MASIRASPACGNCRSRRIKCNLLRPRCSQCARAGLDCTGYRSQSDLLFRDQTKSTIRKVHTSTTNHSTCRSLVAINPTFDVEELAQKSTLQMITCDNHLSSHAWQNHVHGAAAFLSHLCSTHGLPASPVKEIIEICYTTTLACLISGKAVPHFLLELPGHFGASPTSSQDDEDPLLSAMRLFAIMGTLVTMRGLANQGFFTPNQLVVLATQSDQVLQNWASSLPTSWTYHELPKGPQYIYRDGWYARMWNYYRLARILANRIIIDNFDMLSPSPGDNFESHDYSYATISLLAQDIYASLPFMFNSEQMPATSLPLSAALFFTTTLLQALLELTDRAALIQDWSYPACEVLGERFTFTKGIVMQNLQ
ncbi:unnamed protein product [Penicillium glandicola]